MRIRSCRGFVFLSCAFQFVQSSSLLDHGAIPPSGLREGIQDFINRCPLCFLSFFVLFYGLELHHEIRVRFRANKTGLTPTPGPSSFPTVRSKAFPLLQFFFRCASVVFNVAFVLFIFVTHLSFIRFPGRAVLRNCGIYLYFFFMLSPSKLKLMRLIL